MPVMVASVVGLADRPNMFATTPAAIAYGRSQTERWSHHKTFAARVHTLQGFYELIPKAGTSPRWLKVRFPTFGLGQAMHWHTIVARAMASQ